MGRSQSAAVNGADDRGGQRSRWEGWRRTAGPVLAHPLAQTTSNRPVQPPGMTASFTPFTVRR